MVGSKSTQTRVVGIINNQQTRCTLHLTFSSNKVSMKRLVEMHLVGYLISLLLLFVIINVLTLDR